MNVASKFIYEQKTLRKVCIYTYTAIIPEHLFQRFGGVESTVTATGLVAVLFFCHLL
nr:MAG TPA: hypothetical protein [Caudoviricetes sp.]